MSTKPRSVPRLSSRLTAFAAALLGLCCSSLVLGDPHWPGSSSAYRLPESESLATPTQADLAQSYLRFEQAWSAHPPEPGRVAEVNKRFDRATRMFFSQRAGESMRALFELEWSLGHDQPPPPSVAALASLRARVEPRVWNVGQFVSPWPGPSIRVQSLYESPQAADDVELTLSLQSASKGQVVLTRRLVASFGPGRRIDAHIPLGPDFAFLPPDRYDVMLQAEGFEALPFDRLTAAPRSMSFERRELEVTLEHLNPASDPPMYDHVIARDRAALITDEPSLDRASGYMFDPLVLLAMVRDEVRVLGDYSNPYKNRIGDLWRLLRTPGGGVIPMRLYAPRAINRGWEVPVVIALHGAGGNEHMFMDAYGAGRLRQLADRKGFLAVTPATIPFGADAANLDLLLDALELDYPIDRSRIYIIGHSLGAVSAAKFASAKSDTLAAVVCFAGFDSIPGGASICPVSVIYGGLDEIFPPDRIAPAAKAAEDAGLPVTARAVPDAGHTLMVSTELPGAIDWLMEHTNADALRRHLKKLQEAEAAKDEQPGSGK